MTDFKNNGNFCFRRGGVTYRRKVVHNIFGDIISLDNLLIAWKEFRRGKRQKKDVQEFEFNLEENLFSLHESLLSKTYYPESYQSFYVQDPKLRHIHKATVRDRVLHQALFRILYTIFDRQFIYDSYSCRLGKGVHRAVNRLNDFLRKESYHYSKPIFVLKCDIRKFFDSIDQQTLLNLIKQRVVDPNTIWLVEKIIYSFEKLPDQGLPLGNVTSQLFANIYLNELDQFVKHKLRVKYYLRYCDDFAIVSDGKDYLVSLIPQINNFLNINLRLDLHPKKITLRKFSWGVDFLGYVILPHHILLRTKTKGRILSRLGRGEINEKSLPSYLGIIGHCQGFKIRKQLFIKSKELTTSLS